MITLKNRFVKYALKVRPVIWKFLVKIALVTVVHYTLIFCLFSRYAVRRNVENIVKHGITIAGDQFRNS